MYPSNAPNFYSGLLPGSALPWVTVFVLGRSHESGDVSFESTPFWPSVPIFNLDRSPHHALTPGKLSVCIPEARLDGLICRAGPRPAYGLSGGRLITFSRSCWCPLTDEADHVN